ncbi:MAG: DUF3108 domain-containing protein [Candidatus Symbiothrix sp.]|jgi:hypothetical protein|nr:DUF3108 domain-containing protein [Candidatus Symbiothrix sp.]
MKKIQTSKIQTQTVETRSREYPVCRVYDKIRLPGILLCFLLRLSLLEAQTDSLPFQNGEELHYDIRYKYGLVMLKAGTGKYRIDQTGYHNQTAYRSVLDFKTTSFFDKAFKIRDTLTSYVSTENLAPLFHNRTVNEGNSHYREDIFVHRHTSSHSEVRVIQERNNQIRFDTILSADNSGYDILNIFMFVRTLDYSTIKPGDTFQTTIFMARDKINVLARCIGQEVIEKTKKRKYKAIKLNIDITDDAFREAKNAMEIWISDDKNRIPLKLKAKLKIGAAEAELATCKNLKYPFSAEITDPRH